MRYYFNFILILCTSYLLAQQQEIKPYFQQEVHFDIKVTLDDQAHSLSGQWQMEYTNHSPDTLQFIYIHLWPNAFKQRNTAFAQQKLRSNSTRFYFSEDKNFGNIADLAFESGGKALAVETTEQGVDVIKLMLNEPLHPFQKILISSPFTVKIPASFSRLGHVGQSYQITQWYPKPAVYDRDGWHPMPYLDMGEFYSEFGDYTITISLPENYIVGSTGVLQDEEELAWLLERSLDDAQKKWSADDPAVSVAADFPPSSQPFKTLHYRAENVHDFAWFADKRFYVLHDTIALAPGRTIDAWSYFTDREAHLWQKSMDYIKRSTHFYSDLVGEYPYPQVSALQSALSAGGGMEYPMVTVIGLSGDAQSLDEVITHEVGHNWFYGILASNERDHAWMDEGFNSYYDHRYVETYYGAEASRASGVFDNGPHSDLEELAYRYFACQCKLKAPDTTSDELEGYNYWLGAYGMPAMGLKQLETHIGKERFDQAFKAYYQQWQFKHPQPEDAQTSLEKATGEDLSWFFQGLLGSSATQDYAIKSVKNNNETLAINVCNQGEIAGPFDLVAETEDGDTIIQQLDGFDDRQIVNIPKGDYKKISIDPLHTTIDLKRQNNYWHKGTKRIEPFKIRAFSLMKDENNTNLFLLPLVTYNKHDGVMAGLAVFNRALLPTPFEYWLIPSYGFKSKEVVGLGAARYRWWPASDKIQELSLFSSYRRFHFDTYEAQNTPLAYQRFVAGAKIDFPKKTRWRKSLQFRTIWIDEEDEVFSNEGEFIGTASQDRRINELSFNAKSKWVLSPTQINFAVEQSNYVDAFKRDQNYVKLRIEAKGKVLYERKKAIYWRFFGGLFLQNSLNASTFTPPNAFSLFDHSASDNRYDNLYIDRSATDGFLNQQLANRAGGFHSPVAAVFNVGRSNNSLFSLNMSADLPFTPSWLPIKPYADIASFFQPDFDGGSRALYWNGGLAMEWLDGKVGIYLPLVGSPEVMDRLKEQGGVFERLSFRVLLRDLSPWKWVDGIEGL